MPEPSLASCDADADPVDPRAQRRAPLEVVELPVDDDEDLLQASSRSDGERRAGAICGDEPPIVAKNCRYIESVVQRKVRGHVAGRASGE